jgi:DNA-binding NarL/FixJ family response regulator
VHRTREFNAAALVLWSGSNSDSGNGMLSGHIEQRGPRRVVIVSDDPLFIETTSLGFRTGGEFKVFHCPGATRVSAAAITRVGRDAVLIDDVETTDAALDLVRELCAQVERPAVLVLTTTADAGRTDELLAAGAVAVVSKSLHNGALVSFLRELLCGRICVRREPETAGRDEATRLTVVA